MRARVFILIACWASIHCKNKDGSTVDDFIGQLSNFFNQGGFYENLALNASTTGIDLVNGVINQESDLRQKPLTYSPNVGSNIGSSGAYPPEAYPTRPSPFLQQQIPPIRPPFGQPQASFIDGLSSIAQYDDLRCVPRLLCEITAGRRPNSNHVDNNQSPLPFVSKDALITLLTVLNFVDDSPILLFARAALLGYSSKGDTRSCLLAYPTCPRDPDQLVDYLNNHNGGFFRFFNQQLYQLPQYAPQYEKLYQKRKKYQAMLKSESGGRLLAEPSQLNLKYGIKSRILNDPIDVQYTQSQLNPTQYGQVSTVQFGLPFVPRRKGRKVVFQTEDSANSGSHLRDNYYTRNFRFPKSDDSFGSFSNTEKMVFPDRTGTGNLILNSNYKVDYASGVGTKHSKIRFERDTDTKILFPRNEYL